ncbi:ABC transporter, partial [Streptomyces sp. SID69]|nr:ABC transporter [Streptomyces sp. SID69]
TGSRSGRVPVPLLPLAGAALLTAAAFAAACALTARRTP